MFTGALGRMMREEAKDLGDLGARAAGSVSKNTDYVIGGPGAGSTLEKARALGVPVLSEAEWSALVSTDP